MLFILLAKQKSLGYEGLEKIRDLTATRLRSIEDIKELKAPENVKIKQAYFTLGRYDAVMVIETEDVRKALDFATQVLFETGYEAETLTAMPVSEA